MTVEGAGRRRESHGRGWSRGEINYQDGPGGARQVIAVDSLGFHTVNLSLSPGPFYYSAPYLYTAQSVCIGTSPDTISVSLTVFLSLFFWQ